MKEKRGSWYLLTGVVLGFGLGLLYAWVISPARVTNVSPENMASNYKEGYRAAIASAYMATGDLRRAQARLQLLQDENPAGLLAAQSQRYLAEGKPYGEAEALAVLAAALEQNNDSDSDPPTVTQVDSSPVTATMTPSPTQEATLTPSEAVTPSITGASSSESVTPEASQALESTATITISPSPTFSRTPIVTFTPLPTRTLTPTLFPPFVFSGQDLVCDPDLIEAQLQIFVVDDDGGGIPGVEIIIQEDGMEEHFYTGLKPDLGKGYADYTMEPEVDYSLQIGKGGESVPVTAPECSQNEGERYWGSWRLTFTTP